MFVSGTELDSVAFGVSDAEGCRWNSVAFDHAGPQFLLEAIYNHNDESLDQAALFCRLDRLLNFLRSAECPVGKKPPCFLAAHRISLMLPPPLSGSKTWRIGVLTEVWWGRVSNGEKVSVFKLEGGERLCFGSSDGGRICMPDLFEEQACRYVADLATFAALSAP